MTDVLVKRLRLATALGVLALASPACSLISDSTSGGDNDSNIVYMWIGADADAFTWCALNAPGCPNGETNYGRNGTLPIAFTQLDLKRTYLHFELPTLPSGTNVEEAYLELYNGSRNEDGRSDDINIPVALVPTVWDPLTITHNNQPFQSTPSGFAAINLNSQAWSGTQNIAFEMRSLFASPASNNGFVIYWPSASPPAEKAFYGINDIRRTRTNLWLSPRLLVKVVLPEGMTAADITLNPLLNTDDLNPSGAGPILMVQTFSGGSDWPDSWGVTKGQ